MLKDRQLPPAYYVRPYTPRWKPSELLAALEFSRGYPDQMKGHARRVKIMQQTRQDATPDPGQPARRSKARGQRKD